MSHLTPSPCSSALPGGVPRPGRLAPDLGPSERALAERVAALPRAHLPEGLGMRCLNPPEEHGHPEEHGGSSLAWAAGSRWNLARRWRVSLAVAAALLLALGVASLAGSRGETNAQGQAHPGATFASLHVVDDPSVPLFHGLETFDQLAGSVVAVASGSVAPGGGSRSGR